MPGDADEIDAAALAALSPDAFRQFIIRCVRRLCWEMLSCDGTPEDRETAVRDIPDELDRAVRENDAAFNSTVSQLGALATAIGGPSATSADASHVFACYSAALNAAFGALATSRAQDGLALLRATMRISELPPLRRHEERPDRDIKRRAIRRDLDAALAASTAAAQPIDFGPLWLPGELPDDAYDWGGSLDQMENRVIAIVGCTASGKGKLGRALARALGGEIVSVDSMKVYRGMDIGTAKPSAEARAEVPHHLIDVVDPWESFSAADFVEQADRAVEDIHRRGKPALAVGGSMLYFRCFYEGLFDAPSANAEIRAEIRRRAESEGLDALHAELARVDPEAAGRIHRNDLRRVERALEVYQLTGRPISEMQREWDAGAIRRPDWSWTLIGLRREREKASRRINARVRRMIDLGLVEEARRIWSDPRGVSEQARQATGYAELFEHFAGRLTLERAIEEIKIHSRHLAKHQRTWQKRFPAVRWLDVTPADDVASLLRRAMELMPGA